ncbi:conserved fungal protein [Gigaspora margarita]|uniref:Conserved fungal protein n=1 Tax=Gigaspora margarita TaxID=4874 RepID=A0A8H3XB04_GIGMA|nr:conserved fungal protein [Gigaspora margarita]
MLKLSFISKFTFISIILQAIIITVLESFVIYFHVNFVKQYQLSRQGDGISEADLIYHAIFILSLFFQVLLAADALWNRNAVQLMSLVLFNFLSLIYAGIQLYQHKILEDEGTQNATYAPDTSLFPINDRDAPKRYYEARMRPIEHTIIGLISGFSVYLAFMSYKLSKEFGWENYKTYSADIKLRNTYLHLTILQTLIKLDVFFIGSYALQLIPSQKIGYTYSIMELVLIFFFGTLMLLLAWFSVTMEMKYLLLSVINVYSLSLIYFAYRLVTVNVITSVDGTDPYEFTRRFLSFFLATTFGLVAVTVFYSVICFRNMMRGYYVLTVFGRSENEAEGLSPYFGVDNLESLSPKTMSKRQSAIYQQRLRAQEPKVVLD